MGGVDPRVPWSVLEITKLLLRGGSVYVWIATADCFKPKGTSAPVVDDGLEDGGVFIWQKHGLVLVFFPFFILEECLEVHAVHKIFMNAEDFLFCTNNDFEDLGTIRTRFD
jgi:hypothetical protein